MATIPQSAWRVQPWKNGGGVTREILRWPDTDDYDLRVSLAEVTAAGPFSKFPGYSRFLAWIGPNPLELRTSHGILTYATPSATSHFLGDPEIVATLPSGPTRGAEDTELGHDQFSAPIHSAIERNEPSPTTT